MEFTEQIPAMFYEQIVSFESQKLRMHPHLCSYEE
uniref:Uncharacterized protein n=1 Tax=Manihot esculenta TaxID=3983 RepID=A0A199UA84_MANES